MAQLENSLSTASGEASTLSYSGGNGVNPILQPEGEQQQPPPAKKKRNQPGMPDPEAEVVALSPKTLMATNRFLCETCGKGFQRDQNLQLHRRGHNLPWKLRQRGPKEAVRKRVYVCPEPGCVHHDPCRALGDLTGIKKHFCRKHGEKKWKCDRCSKKYAVQSDWKAHLKTCGSREYKCDCGTIFSRRDSFVTHRAFCDALAQESAKVQSISVGSPAGTAPASPPATSTSAVLSPVLSINHSSEMQEDTIGIATSLTSACCSTSSACNSHGNANGNGNNNNGNIVFDGSIFAPLSGISPSISLSQPQPQPQPQRRPSFPNIITAMPYSDCPATYPIDIVPPPALSLSPLYQFSSLFPAPEQDHRCYSSQLLQPTMSATALLQKAAQMGASASGSSLLCGFGLAVSSSSPSRHDHQDQKCMKQENGSGLELGLPSGEHFVGTGPMMSDASELFGPKPMTLDLLGLGIGPEDSSAGAFPAYLNSIGSPLDVTAAFRGGNNLQVKASWDGHHPAQIKPNGTVL